jgi:SPOR domain
VRVAVYVLVLANVLFFGWAHWIDVPPPPPPSSIAGLPQLTLVSELPPDKRVALAAAQKLALEKAAQVCVSVGPFDDPAVAGQAAALLKGKNFEPRQRTVEDPAVRRFWVYLQGFSSDASELRALHRLERAGIDDAEAMPADAGGRKVSLGLFTDKVRAARRARAVRTLGFNPAMSERLLPGTVYWLDLTLANGTVAVPLKEVAGLQPNGSSSPVSLQPCPPPSAAATPEQPQALASPANSPAVAPKAATAAASSSATVKPALPLCKPGGPIPCIVVKERKQPSVL